MRKQILAFLFSITFFLAGILVAPAQVRPVNDYGALGLGQLLRRLQTTGSVLMIGAHPDDEDSALLAYLARGENVRTAYLSLTRGDGGQNIIGPELFEALGIIRTEELLQARRLDGAEQYFTRAYDYGFSKTLAEARSKWPEDAIKCDVVRVIRSFRPLVVISRFTGTPRDGHGQHQYAGYISPIAVKAAADPQQCLDTGEPWTVKKFYVESGFGDSSEPTLRINTGQFDPILGRTYFEIAMEGRSQHKSQGEGRIEYHGDNFSGLNLVGAPKDKRESDIFEGLDTSIVGISKLTGETDQALLDKLGRLSDKVADAVRNQKLFDEAGAVTTFADIYKLAREARNASKWPDAYRYLLAIESIAAKGLQNAAGIQIDALADSDVVALGESVPISVKTYFPSSVNVRVKDVSLIETCRGVDWGGCGFVRFEVASEPTAAANNRREQSRDARYFTASVSNLFNYLTQPYWLREPRNGDIFSVRRGMVYQEEDTLPFSPPLIMADLKLDIAGVDVDIQRPVEFRFADPARGEIRRDLNIVPALSVEIDRRLLIVPMGDKPQTRRLIVSVTNNSSREQSGKVAISLGSTSDVKIAAPLGLNFDLKTRGAKASIPIDITILRMTGPFDIPIRARAVVGEANYGQTMNVVAYPHIQTHRYYTPADSTEKIIDLKTVPLNVGYIMGSGDEVPDAIREMGMNVTLLDEKALASGDLSKYDTIVVGIRASETRPDFVANNKRLLDYVDAGGNLIVQYQRGNFAASGLLPFPANAQDRQGTAAGPIARVVDENAPVTILQPQHPVFNLPNKITDEDFKGWVQERNAYDLVTFDQRYTPLLESHDAGEQPNNGGMVIANIGKGTYIYTSYSWFRQLPAGVPGAYRIFANMLNLPKILQKKP